MSVTTSKRTSTVASFLCIFLSNATIACLMTITICEFLAFLRSGFDPKCCYSYGVSWLARSLLTYYTDTDYKLKGHRRMVSREKNMDVTKEPGTAPLFCGGSGPSYVNDSDESVVSPPIPVAVPILRKLIPKRVER